MTGGSQSPPIFSDELATRENTWSLFTHDLVYTREREKKICTGAQEHTKGIPKREKPTCKIICITSNPDVLEKESELRSIRLVLLVHLLEDRRIWRGLRLLRYIDSVFTFPTEATDIDFIFEDLLRQVHRKRDKYVLEVRGVTTLPISQDCPWKNEAWFSKSTTRNGWVKVHSSVLRHTEEESLIQRTPYRSQYE